KVLRNREYRSNKKLLAEFDIIGINGTKVFLGEIKTKLGMSHIKKFIEKTLPKFKEYIKDKSYGELEVYGVMGARTFADEKTKRFALDNGLYLVTENHEGKAKIVKESIKSAVAFV
ncbi:MAG: hypothetical protein Q9M94_05375, partial [Candidatus Gracilibacteria bacterium]|nr:hypothetical protein [Candidatus Gracilibacteria bacterium]